jgi:glycosyltransferase involved in cell wall biosynthesis
MRVLLLNDMSTPSGGAELETFTLRDGLRARGHEAVLLSSTAPAGPGPVLADHTCFGTTSRWRALLRVANPSAYRVLRGVLQKFQPDVVHVRMFLTELSPIILPLLRRVPSLYHAVWYESVCPTGLKQLPDGRPCVVRAGWPCYRNGCVSAPAWAPVMLQRKLWQRWRGAFDLVVANSHAVKRQLLADGIKSVEVVWNGVPSRATRPVLKSPPRIGYAGRLTHEKGVTVLLEAFRMLASQVTDARLLIAGEGPERGLLEQRVRDLNLEGRVTLLGQVPRDQLDELLGGVWVQAVPSCWAEPFGLVAAEAMMRGVAVVASASGGLAEIVEHERTGLLVPPGDTNALAAALLRLVRDPALADAMGQGGRQRALDYFNAETFVDRFVDLYRRIGADHFRAERLRKGHRKLEPQFVSA